MDARTVKAWLFLGLTVTLEVVATLCLRASEGFTVLMPSAVAVAAYAGAVVVLALALQVIPMSIAYVIWTGVGTTGIVVFSILLFGDSLTVTAWVGIVLVIIGVIMINLHRPSTEKELDAFEEHPQ